MRRALWLSVLTAVILAAGGCKQQETLPAPQPAPVVTSQQEQAVKDRPQPAVAEKIAVPAVTAPAVIPPPPVAVIPATAPVKKVPVETTKAAPVPAAPPAAAKTVTYKASNGTVTFDHQRHAGNNTCRSCHPTEPPVRIVLDKDKAHQLCKGCHQQKGSGPTQCPACHKKG